MTLYFQAKIMRIKIDIRMFRAAVIIAVLAVVSVGLKASEKSATQAPRHEYRLKSMRVIPSYEDSYSIYTFGYDSLGRMSSERVEKVSSIPYDDLDITFTVEYPENELLIKINGKEFRREKLKGGNIPDKFVKFKKGRRISEKIKFLWGRDESFSGIDRYTFNWEGDDVTSISFFKKSKHLGDLEYQFREEACNSPLIYAHTYGMIYTPLAFCPECHFNHVAIFHCGLPTPTRLFESYVWPDGRKGKFSYEFDENANPTKIIVETHFRGEMATIIQECQWEEVRMMPAEKDNR